MKRLFIILLFVFTICVNVEAQKREVIRASDTLQVYFRQGYSTWEPNFKGNGERMEKFVERVKELRSDSVLTQISKIHIIAGCSPEGTWKLNQRLSRKRADRIRGVLKGYVDLPDSVIVEESRGIDWEGLYEMVEASDMAYRDEVLDIIKNTPELERRGRSNIEIRKRKLVWLDNSRPWRYMYRHFFPKLRAFYLQIVIEWEKIINYDPLNPVVENLEIEPRQLEIPEPPRFERPEPAPLYVALKTNMLYDAALIPNIGAEVYLGENYSLTGNWMYAWWKSSKHHNFWRTYGGDLEIRRYFGSKAAEKPLQGWHLGLYGQMLTYDFELGGRGYLGDRWTWGGGLSLGYSAPLLRRINLDITLGLGYLGGEYKEYLPIDGCYVWQKTKQRRWFGPTKAEISLVWLIGRGNYNKDK